MDKLRLYTSYKTAIPRHIRKGAFDCTGEKRLQCGLSVFYYADYETGVHLTSHPHGITVECNPTTFQHGNNYQMIDRKGLQDFTHAFSERYETDFSVWDVSLFDYNADIAVRHKPATYFKHLGDLKSWERTPKRNGNLTYKTASDSRAFVAYDLHLKCKKNKQPIPPECEGVNKLRLETSFNKGLSNVKALQNMTTLADYTQPHNYKQLPQLWLDTYEAVDKNEGVEHIPDLTLKEELLLAAIEKYTLAGYREKLKIDYPKDCRYHIQKVNALLQKIRLHRNKEGLLSHIDELNQKVRDRAKELILAA